MIYIPPPREPWLLRPIPSAGGMCPLVLAVWLVFGALLSCWGVLLAWVLDGLMK